MSSGSRKCGESGGVKWSRYETPMAREALALYEALPLRRINERDPNVDFCILECGHLVPDTPALDRSGRVRCQACYNEFMADAERMISAVRP